MQEGWSMLRDESVYDESLPDNNPYETPFTGTVRPVFPYVFSDDSLRAKNRNYDLVKSTPLGMELTTDFALRSIEAEQLGQDEFTDFLCLSYSGTDYVGHRFGIMARETQDAYLRLDLEIERLLNYLDEHFPNQYLIVLTADHGGSEVPSQMEKEQIKGGYWNPGNMVDDVKAMLNKEFGQGDYVLDYINDQFFLDRELIASRKIDMSWMQRMIAARAMEYEGVYAAYTADRLLNYEFTEGMQGLLKNGWYPRLSGDVLVVLEPGWIEYGRTGTTHGSGYTYDTHVPVIFYGSNILPMQLLEEVSVSDIAPTIAGRLGIMEPNGCTGRIIPIWWE
jgi:arylsulfatase A-like enzyme